MEWFLQSAGWTDVQRSLFKSGQRPKSPTTPRSCHTARSGVCVRCRSCRKCGKTSQTTATAERLFSWYFALVPFGFRSHSHNSPSRNLHWRPILIAGISLHSAHRHTVRGAIPSHCATAAVVRNDSRFDSDLFMSAFSLVSYCGVVLWLGKLKRLVPRRRRRLSSVIEMPSAGLGPKIISKVQFLRYRLAVSIRNFIARLTFRRR
jgi:hypothetical protein